MTKANSPLNGGFLSPYETMPSGNRESASFDAQWARARVSLFGFAARVQKLFRHPLQAAMGSSRKRCHQGRPRGFLNSGIAGSRNLLGNGIPRLVAASCTSLPN